MTGVTIQRLYVDKGYRGHNYDGKAKVMISGKKRGLTPTMKRELKRRSAIEPMIGHAKNDGRLKRNDLLGTVGDKINALLAAASRNLWLFLMLLVYVLARFTGGCPAVDGVRPPDFQRRRPQTRVFEYWSPTFGAPNLNGLGVFQGGLLKRGDHEDQ
jgi:hypothetical protein